MSKKLIRKYKVDASKYDVFLDALSESIEVIINPVTQSYSSGYDYSGPLSYEYNEGILQLISYTSHAKYTLTPEELYRLAETGTVFINTYKKLPYQQVDTIFVIDWAGMITDLENLGRVKTLPTNYFLANDLRKFYFADDPNGEESAVDVDYLGTSMAQEISDKVMEEWTGVTNYVYK